MKNLLLTSAFAALMLTISTTSNAQSGNNDAGLKDFSSRFHFSATVNYGDYNYTQPVEEALSESGYRKEVITYPEYGAGDFMLDLFTFGLYSYGSSYGPIVSYEKPVFEKTASVLKMDASYNLKPRLQLGFAYSGYSNSLFVMQHPAHGNQLCTDVNVNSFNTYAAYDVTPYERRHKCALGLRLGAGLTGNIYKENQHYTTFNIATFEEGNYNYSAKLFQYGVMADVKVDLYFGKHFSLVLLDLTINQPFNQPSTGQSANNPSTSIASHKADTRTVTAGFGMGLHF